MSIESFANKGDTGMSDKVKMPDFDKRVDKTNVGDIAFKNEKKIYDPDNRLAGNINEHKVNSTDLNKEGVVKEPIQVKKDGLEREQLVSKELAKKYPDKEGYQVVPETYLRDVDGKIVKDSVSGEARRVDFMVIKDGKVLDSIEVTSLTADKTKQMEKENRIREDGGNYIKDNNGKLVEFPFDIKTRIERKA